MTQDEIIQLAWEAGLQHIPIDLDYPVIGKAIERFAALVAAHERKACARECWEFYSIEGIAQKCNAAIRARGEK